MWRCVAVEAAMKLHLLLEDSDSLLEGVKCLVFELQVELGARVLLVQGVVLGLLGLEVLVDLPQPPLLLLDVVRWRTVLQM